MCGYPTNFRTTPRVKKTSVPTSSEAPFSTVATSASAVFFSAQTQKHTVPRVQSILNHYYILRSNYLGRHCDCSLSSEERYHSCSVSRDPKLVRTQLRTSSNSTLLVRYAPVSFRFSKARYYCHWHKRLLFHAISRPEGQDAPALRPAGISRMSSFTLPSSTCGTIQQCACGRMRFRPRGARARCRIRQKKQNRIETIPNQGSRALIIYM